MIFTATDEWFLPQPPCEIVWILLAALHIVELSTNNVATTRHSTFNRGIFKNNG